MSNAAKSFEARKKSGAVRVRKNIRKLNDQEINDLRKAYEGIYKISDEVITDQRGYQYIAGVHGFPGNFCEHGTLDFVTWHRAYIYEFEKRLQDIVPTVMLPYWDWASETSIEKGMPESITVDTYVDENGDTKPNPLKSAFSQATGTNTSRNPGPLTPNGRTSLQELSEEVAQALAEETFRNFSPALENPHGGLHVWVGNDMSRVRTAAFDPIFWLHHANVDRQWWEWQQKHPNADYPDSVKEFQIRPFGYTGEQTLDSEAFFGVTYADHEAYAVPADEEDEAGRDAALPPVMTLDLGAVPKELSSARLEFHNLKKTEDSYEIRAYANEPSCDATTKRLGNDKFAGSHHIFGHGECIGAKGHCDLPSAAPDRFDHRPPHHLTPYNTHIDVTGAIRAAVTRGDATIKLHFVVIDADTGKQVGPSVIEYDGIALVTQK